MTLHSAKGLEFPRVFIVGVEDNLLPHSTNINDPVDLEEERRLLYVGMTRAKVKLTLLSAKKRRIFNNWMANRPSRFLGEIPQKHMASTYAREVEPVPQPLVVQGRTANSEESQDATELYEGATVRHPAYGRGVVEAIEEEFGVVKATVKFRDFGKRKVSCSQLESQELSYDFEL
jgi:DNA helicase-2/ATP-dependent DNA helicase PcrA